MTWFLQILVYMSDAYGFTIKSEKWRVVQKILGLIIITLLFVTHKLNLTNFFLYHYAVIVFLSIMIIWIIKRSGYPIVTNWRVPFRKVKNYIREFYYYSYPLFFFALFGLATGILDRWLLQFFRGSIEQGFFGLSYQISAVCFLTTSAMTPLITREFSIAFSQKNIDQMAHLFRRYIPLLFSIAAFVSCFISVQAEKVIYIMGGSKYTGAYAAVSIMSLYPIHQTYGQLSGSIFMATGQTSLYSKIGIIFMLLGLPLTFFLIAPENKMGFNTGATGLAIKMVLIQIISVNIQLYYNSRLLNQKFWKYVSHQFVCIICLIVISFFSLLIVDKGFGLHDKVMFSFIISGMIYTSIVIILIYFKPIIFGLSKKDIPYLIQLAKSVFLPAKYEYY